MRNNNYFGVGERVKVNGFPRCSNFDLKKNNIYIIEEYTRLNQLKENIPQSSE